MREGTYHEGSSTKCTSGEHPEVVDTGDVDGTQESYKVSIVGESDASNRPVSTCSLKGCTSLTNCRPTDLRETVVSQRNE